MVGSNRFESEFILDGGGRLTWMGHTDPPQPLCICAGFLIFPVGNVAPFPPIEDLVSNHTLQKNEGSQEESSAGH